MTAQTPDAPAPGAPLDAAADTPPAAPRARRTEVLGLTIDGPTSRDLDDAVWVSPTPDGYLVDVSIADVAAAIKPGSRIDMIARQKVETEYLGDHNRPMLPRFLADDKLSLLPHRTRRVVTTRLHLDADLSVQRVEVVKGVLVSRGRLAHADVDVALLNPDAPWHAQLTLLQRVATAFYERRRARGACAFYDVRSHLYADEDGTIRKHDFIHAQIIVQELMIAANQAMAEFAGQLGVPFLYRNHEASVAAPTREQIMAQVESAIAHGDQLGHLAQRMVMWMRAAEYGTAVLGHFGLNLPAYTHGTSPIRRYVDLVNQRQLKAAIQGQPLPYTVADLAAIAGEVNAWKTAKRQAKADTMKERTADARRRQLATATAVNFRGMPVGKFSQLLKRAVADETVGDELAAEVERRAAAGTLTAFDHFAVLFQARHPGMHAAVMAQMDQRPTDAVSVMTVRQQVTGEAYEVAFGGQDPGPWAAIAWAAVGERRTFAKSPCQAWSKQEAKGMATLAWLREYLAGTLEDADMPVLPPPVRPMPAVGGGSDTNYVGLLVEWCQQGRRPTPTYTFDSSGPPHAPTFTCTASVTVRGEAVTRTAAAPSKQLAKTDAARLLLLHLKEKP